MGSAPSSSGGATRDPSGDRHADSSHLAKSPVTVSRSAPSHSASGSRETSAERRSSSRVTASRCRSATSRRAAPSSVRSSDRSAVPSTRPVAAVTCRPWTKERRQGSDAGSMRTSRSPRRNLEVGTSLSSPSSPSTGQRWSGVTSATRPDRVRTRTMP